nr:MAG TPA: Repressor protein CI [Caudoviricetes sp.]
MNRIPELRKERGISMKQAAEQLGMPYTTYVNYEKGARQPNSETLIDLANFYNTSIDYMLGKSNERIDEHTLDVVNELDLDTLARAGNIRDALRMQTQKDTSQKPIPPGFRPLPEMVQVPLIGSIACGTPITAEQNIKSYIGVPAAWRADFALECHGDSMAPTICDGDVVCIRKQPEVEQGQIAAVRIGEEATLKHFYYQNSVMTLLADNPSVCPPMVYTGPQLEEVEVEGLAVGFCRGLV